MRRRAAALTALLLAASSLLAGVSLPLDAAAAGGPPAAPGPLSLLASALETLAHQYAFRTVRQAPSLEVVTVVEPLLHRQAATLRFSGPRGRGVLHSIVAGSTESFEGDAAGWSDFLLQSGAPPSAVALAGSLAGHWYSSPTPVGFGPSLAGVGHVLCAGTGCSLRDASLRSYSPTGAERAVVDLPGLGGLLLIRLGRRPLPLAFLGTGRSAGVELRFAYPGPRPAIRPPAAASPLPAALSA